MISVARKARPRRSPNRVQLVEADGSAARPSAESWPAWTDNHFWESGESQHDLAGHVHIDPPEPDAPDGEAGWIQVMIEASLPPVEADGEFLARVAAEDAAEKARVMATYQPLPEDLAELAAWSESLDGYRGQVSSEELGQLAAHGCI
jgi:hypothetical protein